MKWHAPPLLGEYSCKDGGASPPMGGDRCLVSEQIPHTESVVLTPSAVVSAGLAASLAMPIEGD